MIGPLGEHEHGLLGSREGNPAARDIMELRWGSKATAARYIHTGPDLLLRGDRSWSRSTAACADSPPD